MKQKQISFNASYGGFHLGGNKMQIDDKILETAYGLDGGAWLLRLGRKKIEAAYNGIGAEWMPEIVRKTISKILWLFQPCAVLHDCQYEYLKDRSDEMFNKVNLQFKNNCYKLMEERYCFLNPLRYWRYHQADAAYEILQKHGKKAWEEGGKKCK